VLIELRYLDRAESLLNQALELAKGTFGIDHPETAMILANYASVLKQTERKRQGRSMQAQAHDIITRHAQRNLLQHSVDVSQLVREHQ
jgi:hypothetical protein